MIEIEPTHFTYKSFELGDDLYQGDILEPTKSIRSIFKQVHPHFLSAKYTAFLVLTQTCDLVRRNGISCESRYINLAVVRPLEDVLWTFLDRVCEKIRVRGKFLEGIYVKESKFKAEQLLERIVNQNEQGMGIFYLHPDAAVKIPVHSVALLQVSIAVRAKEHYDLLVRARCGRLSEQFRDKLGWLIGNLFSRVATDDLPKEMRKKIISGFLKPSNGIERTPCWVPRENARLANKRRLDIENLPREQLAAYLEQQKPESPKDIAINQAISVINEIAGPFSNDILEIVRLRLSNDPVFLSACK